MINDEYVFYFSCKNKIIQISRPVSHVISIVKKYIYLLIILKHSLIAILNINILPELKSIHSRISLLLLLATLFCIIITACPWYNCPTSTVLLGATVAEETAVLAVCYVMVPVTDSSAHWTTAGTVRKATGVTVVPMLVHKYLQAENSIWIH